RELRTLIVDIAPPDLPREGLESALSDLLAPLSEHGVETTMDVAGGRSLDGDTELLLYRAAREALRNVVEHAEAHHVRLSLGMDDGSVRLVVEDDGAGFSPTDLERRR